MGYSGKMWMAARRMVFPDGTCALGAIEIQEGKIVRVCRGRPRRPERFWEDGWLLPGWVDVHVHGARGCDAMDATLASWETISRFHARGGTTSFCLTTVAALQEQLEPVLRLASTRPALSGARLLGIHLEGPWLSPERRGAHEAANLRTPKNGSWKSYTGKYQAAVLRVTLAPELPGAVNLIRQLLRRGISVSAGHTNAGPDHLKRAYRAGLRQATHLFNCMSSARKVGAMRQTGAVEFFLTRDDSWCELIGDGFHVPDDLLRLAVRARGVEGLVLITDATAGAGLPVGTCFRVGGGLKARALGTHALTLDGQALAGSTCRMIDGFRRLVRVGGMSVAEASRAASANPARAVGRANQIGALAPGLAADFLLLDGDLKLVEVWRDGRRVV